MRQASLQQIKEYEKRHAQKHFLVQESPVQINLEGGLCEVVDFGSEVVEYGINGVTEHVIYGIFFSFHQSKTK